MSERREQIIAAAVELAQERGLPSVSVRAAAERAGIGASTLRYYFPTQRELARAVTERMLASAVPDLNIRDSSIPADRRLAECLLQYLPQEAESAAPLTSAWAEAIGRAFGMDADEASEQLMVTMYEASLSHVEAWLAVLADEGAIAESEIPAAASLLSAAADGFMLQLAAGAVTLDQVRDRLLRLCSALLQPSAA